LRLIARIRGEKLKPVTIAKGTEDASLAQKRSRKCLFDGRYIDTPVYDSEKLKAGNLIPGPAIIEVPTTTAVIPGNYQCRVDEYNNYIITRRS
jgi:N-methylhydantoinase A